MQLDVKFAHTTKTIDTKFTESDQTLGVAFSGLQAIGEKKEYYTGDYEITPKVNAQILPTADKVLTDDLTVKAIPIYKVANTQNGITVTIG